MDLIRPLGLAGIVCAAPARSGVLLQQSRFVRTTFTGADPAEDPEGFVDDLAAFAAGQSEPPVLFYQGDWDLLAISRHRERLAAVAEPAVLAAFRPHAVLDVERDAFVPVGLDLTPHLVGVVRPQDILKYLAEAFPEELLNLPPRPHQQMEQPEGG